MCSIHANSARDALVKLATLPLLAGRNIDSSFVVPTVAGAIDLVVHCELVRGGRRRVAEIVAPTGDVVEGSIEAQSIFTLRGEELAATGTLPAREQVFARAGLDPRPLLRSAVNTAVTPAVTPAVNPAVHPSAGPRAVPA